MEGLILAAGKGTRLAPEKPDGVCKALVEVGSDPLLAYSLENLIRLGVKKAVIVIGSDHDPIVETFGNTYRGIALRYAVQQSPRGLVNAMVCAAPLLTEDVILQLSDEIFLHPTLEPALAVGENGVDFTVGFTHDVSDKIKINFSIETDEALRILRCEEKPKAPQNDMKGTGFSVFTRDCFALLADAYDSETNRPNDLCDFINLLVAAGKTGKAVPIAAEEINVNTPADLLYARRCVAPGVSTEAAE